MIRDIFMMSLDAMRAHKLRTLLTLLGIILGITAVVTISTAGNSFGYYMREQMEIYTPTSMLIVVGTAGEFPRPDFGEMAFTEKDVERIENLPHIKDVAPIGMVNIIKIGFRRGVLNWNWDRSTRSFLASTPSLLDIAGWEIEEGREFKEGKNEIIISKSMVNFFGDEIGVGSIIYVQRIDRITPLRAEVVGILKERKEMMTMPLGIDIIGPIDPYYSTQRGSSVIIDFFHRVTVYPGIAATATSVESVEEAMNECLDYLNSGESDAKGLKRENLDFVIVSQQDVLAKVNQMVSTESMFIVAIASISLLVGAIGIANIMFATITERTREIGTMMAIGAKRRDILQLFLYQAMIIGLLGGILGCILGASGGAFVVSFLNDYMSRIYGEGVATIPLMYSYEWFFIALVVGIVVGVIAGILPARKAAKMDPVRALKYE